MVYKKLKDTLRETLTFGELQQLVRAYDVLGDVAIIVIAEKLLHHENAIANAILSAFPKIRVVAKRVGNYSGEYRTISLKIIGGYGELETLHKEYGVRLHVDPEKVYFSSRSGSERYRIAQQVLPGETVLVMFSGIGPLPLMIALHSEASEIVGIEKNPEAHYYALKNIKSNSKVSNTKFILGDVQNIIPDLGRKFKRIAMPLPTSASTYLDLAIRGLEDEGWLHFYDFKHEGEFECSEEVIRQSCHRLGRSIVNLSIHKCGHISPGKYRICVDGQVV